MIKQLKKIIQSVLMISVIISLTSCSSSDKKSSSAESATKEAVSETSQAKSSDDFDGLASQKYAEILSQKAPDTKYALKWSYDGEYSNTAVNYIYFSGETGSYSISMTRPLFNDAKFILKDHKMYDIYDDTKTYVVTDMSDAAMNYGYMAVEQFESYSTDIFAGLSYVESGTDKVNGVEYKTDTFSTSKNVTLSFLISDKGELYAIKAIHEDNDGTYMFVEEFSESIDDNAFELPDGYFEEKA